MYFESEVCNSQEILFAKIRCITESLIIWKKTSFLKYEKKFSTTSAIWFAGELLSSIVK
jgi:hypothetical protein